jgi:hypothetical protein
MGPKLNFDIEASKKGCSDTSNELLLTEKSLANLIESVQTLKRRMGTEEQLVILDHQQILESKHTAESCKGQPNTLQYSRSTCEQSKIVPVCLHRCIYFWWQFSCNDHSD